MKGLKVVNWRKRWIQNASKTLRHSVKAISYIWHSKLQGGSQSSNDIGPSTTNNPSSHCKTSTRLHQANKNSRQRQHTNNCIRCGRHPMLTTAQLSNTSRRWSFLSCCPCVLKFEMHLDLIKLVAKCPWSKGLQCFKWQQKLSCLSLHRRELSDKILQVRELSDKILQVRELSDEILQVRELWDWWLLKVFTQANKILAKCTQSSEQTIKPFYQKST